MEKFKIKKGLDILLDGEAKPEIVEGKPMGNFAVKVDDLHGRRWRPLKAEGDDVKQGGAVVFNTDDSEQVAVSPVGGKVKKIVRGERRKLLRVEIEANAATGQQELAPPADNSADAALKWLKASGLSAFIKERPFDIVAAMSVPRDIWISLFNQMPLGVRPEFALRSNMADLQRGISLLARIAPVNIGISLEQEANYACLSDCTMRIFSGKNPAGTVGVQINHVRPINKGERVWTLSPQVAVWIGRALNDGKTSLDFNMPIGGSMVENPRYRHTLVGESLDFLAREGWLKAAADEKMVILGNPLTGIPAQKDDFVGSATGEISVIPAGTDTHELFGWIRPRLGQFSTSHSYFAWLNSHKRYNLDARIKGSERHMIMSGEYERVFPLDILPEYLIRAIITNDIDRMEQLGIYEVAPEDFALAEFVDSSKLPLQQIVRDGLDYVRKEMA